MEENNLIENSENNVDLSKDIETSEYEKSKLENSVTEKQEKAATTETQNLNQQNVSEKEINENLAKKEINENLAKKEKDAVENSKENENIPQFSIEEIASTMIEGSDEQVYEKLKSSGVTFEESVNIRKEFVKMAKESLFKKDLQELLDNFNDVNANSIVEIPNFKKFALLRGNGLSVKDAFLGANPKYSLERENKGDFSHMTQKKIGSSIISDLPIPQKELKLWRSAFPKDSDQQLTKRYNEAIKG